MPKLCDEISIGYAVPLYPKLASRLGSRNAAILLAHIHYWGQKSEDGWVYKVSEEWERETSITYREQQTARKLLVSLGLIEEKYARLEHRMYFKVNIKALKKWWSSSPSDGDSDRHLTAMPPSVDGDSERRSTSVVLNKEYFKENIKDDVQQTKRISSATVFSEDSVRQVADRIDKVFKKPRKLSATFLATFFASNLREIRKVSCPLPTRQDLGVIKTTILKKTDMPKEYILFCIKEWDTLRKKITWRNGKPKLDTNPSLEEICLSFNAIHAVWASMQSELKNQKPSEKDSKTGLRISYV